MKCASVLPRLQAQTPATPAASPAFEVASVKINKSGQNAFTMANAPGGRLRATNITHRSLLTFAYGLERFQFSGGLAWLDSEHFDIVAKAPAELVSEMMAPAGNIPVTLQRMLQALLADRFKLVVHNDTEDLPIYALVTTRDDGKLGPHIHASATDCATQAAVGVGAPPSLGTAIERPRCSVVGGAGQLFAGAITLAQFASSLSRFARRTVIDRTGLTGAFDIDLTWTPDQAPQGAPPSPDPLALPSIDSSGPSIFTALQEQRGLKLESTRGPVDVLVIDHVETSERGLTCSCVFDVKQLFDLSGTSRVGRSL